ncbi:hypothetical protein GCM10010275_62140 [Streptomyces litmocidini]|nr:hypothetical protein GCM10010275_62140 [Streptomyces litmocidini]
MSADAIHVRDGEVWSSAGVTAGIDLRLALVEEDRGPEAARAVARDLVVFLQRPGGQSQFSAASRTPRPRTRWCARSWTRSRRIRRPTTARRRWRGGRG